MNTKPKVSGFKKSIKSTANHSKRIFSNGLFWLVLILLLLFVGMMVTFSSLEWPDSAGITVIISFVCAIVGACFTMLITEKQLENQSEHGLETQKNSKVFEEKLDVYKNYINTLCDILTRNSGFISDKDQLDLAFATAMLSLHTSGENMIEIAKDIKAIIGERTKQNGNLINQELINRLLKIVKQLKIQLYEGEAIAKVNIEDNEIKEISEIFNDAYDISSIENEGDNDIKEHKSHKEINIAELNLTKWNQAIEKWEKDGWDVWEGWKKTTPNNQTFSIKRNDGSPGEIKNTYRNGTACIAIQYGNDRQFADDLIVHPLKVVVESQRKGELWWAHDKILGEPNQIVQEMHKNPELQDFLISLIDESMQRIKNWKPTSAS